ncbi:MAG: hypothetical protein KBD36_06600 [Alphaproteobacteria bacterium]|nr:hypothetical protein [Alphaproteobacteria bacterium]
MKTPTPNWLNRIRQQFLLTFLSPDEAYQEKEVNGFFLIKQFNQNQMAWEVAIYTRQSYLKRKAHKEKVADLLKPRRNEHKRG